MTAKPYAYADYDRLQQAGIALEKRHMTLEEIVKKFDGMLETYEPTPIIHDYIDMARQDHDIRIDPVLKLISVQEHFAVFNIQTVFLMVTFTVSRQDGKTPRHERCFACYPKGREAYEKKKKTDIANERLKILYDEIEQASITYQKRFF